MDVSFFRDHNFKRKSNWIVFTGAPCSGKTSVIHHLEKQGYAVMHETARQFIDESIKTGRTLPEIKSDLLAFERQILMRKVDIESLMPPQDLIFLDRGVPDSIAYYIHDNLSPEEPIKHSFNTRYKKIFMFDRLPFTDDAVRSEDVHGAKKLHLLIEQSYKSLGYEIIPVPVWPIPERISFILSNI